MSFFSEVNVRKCHLTTAFSNAVAPPVSAKAFFVTRGGNRFEGCYADGGRCVFVDTGLSKNRWMNGFECCAGGGLGQINHGIILAGDTIGPGLEITHNMFGVSLGTHGGWCLHSVERA